MPILTYDGSFVGFLSAVFCLYADFAYARTPADRFLLMKDDAPAARTGDLFAQTMSVGNDSEKADRVLKTLEKIFSPAGVQRLLLAFLSEDPEVESKLLATIRHALNTPGRAVLHDHAHPAVSEINRLARAVSRERHRLLGFVRFEKTRTDIYFARIAPAYDVLLLLAGHFKRRYADQRWAIFDVSRHFGFYFDRQQLRVIDHFNPGSRQEWLSLLDGDETVYQSLWRTYLTHGNIAERKNPQQHLRQLPKRYWRYLTEKDFLTPGGAG